MDNVSFVEECEINFLTLERAKVLVPPEFLEGWKWFQQNAGTTRKGLPHRINTPAGLPLSLTRDAGIHSPDYRKLKSKGADKRKYVLSIHSGSSRYADKELFWLNDRTWILDYCAQKPESGRKGSASFNQNLMNNLRDGVPVGVLVKNKSNYLVCGLAFIEQYNYATDSFILHGPVTSETEREGFFSVLELDELSNKEIEVLREWDSQDERLKTSVEQVIRQGQQRFRRDLRHAYEDTCVITSVNVPTVLQAAHINSYRGPKSQKVNNGLLLRSDMHLLYDSHLLTIHPENHKVILSDRIRQSDYRKYEGTVINAPRDKSCAPIEELLDMHYQQFILENSRITA